MYCQLNKKNQKALLRQISDNVIMYPKVFPYLHNKIALIEKLCHHQCLAVEVGYPILDAIFDCISKNKTKSRYKNLIPYIFFK